MMVWIDWLRKWLITRQRIRAAKHTRVLDLSGLGLEMLPASVGALPQLRVLDVSRNQLRSLPAFIGELRILEYLNLSNNLLSALPEELQALPILRQIDLHGNKSLGLDRDVMDRSAKEILDVYFGAPFQQTRLHLVGFQGTGKTSLMRRLAQDEFHPDEPETQGVHYSQWTLLLDSDSQMLFHVWDFNGQEILHITHQLFFTQRSIYLVVLNSRHDNEDMDTEYWLNTIGRAGNNSAVIVVLNRIGQDSFDVNRSRLTQKYPQICAFVATDCADGTGIEELRQTIAHQAKQLPQNHQVFRRSWHDVMANVATSLKNRMSFDAYQQICQEKNITDQKTQDELAAWLHDLGLAFICPVPAVGLLSPSWIAQGSYALLAAAQLADDKGVLQRAGLANILPADAYSAEDYDLLLDMMARLEFCFLLSSEEDRFLFPSVLDKQQPEEVQWFSPDKCLTFQYRYEIMPQGLLPRFIVRSHKLNRDLLRWRTGIILQQDGNRALISADTYNNQIDILIDGVTSGRSQLLGMIRAEMEELHRALEVQPQAMIALAGYPDEYVSYQEMLAFQQQGLERFQKVVNGQILDLDVREILAQIGTASTTSKQEGR